jgi:hypothetical protein
LFTGPIFSLLFHLATTEKQTVAFNIQARVNFKSRRRARMGIWQAMEMLDTLVDESDPDVSTVLHSFGLQVNLATDGASDKLVTDRTFAPNSRGHSSGWQTRVDASNWTRSRPRKITFPLRFRRSMGRRRGMRAIGLADPGAWYTDTEPFPQPRIPSSSAANSPTISYIQRRSKQTQTRTIAFIQQNTASTSPTVALIMSCSPGATTRLVP